MHMMLQELKDSCWYVQFYYGSLFVVAGYYQDKKWWLNVEACSFSKGSRIWVILRRFVDKCSFLNRTSATNGTQGYTSRYALATVFVILLCSLMDSSMIWQHESACTDSENWIESRVVVPERFARESQTSLGRLIDVHGLTFVFSFPSTMRILSPFLTWLMCLPTQPLVLVECWDTHYHLVHLFYHKWTAALIFYAYIILAMVLLGLSNTGSFHWK